MFLNIRLYSGKISLVLNIWYLCVTSEFDPLSAISIVFFRVSPEVVSLSVIAILSSVVFRRCFIGLESLP